MRVLYVEDNATNRAVMQAFFQTRPGWQLLLAPEGESGLWMAREQRPDAIVLDLHLPGRDGFEVLRELRARPETAPIPVIALTADARPDERERGLGAGFSAYLTKPVDFEELLAALERAAPRVVV
jgi:CheY-like chemotaxis protein